MIATPKKMNSNPLTAPVPSIKRVTNRAMRIPATENAFILGRRELDIGISPH
ncbi:hypothetical protein JCM19039_4326 [Geomicrobium sp. JCM 19039]|nr:hypothetical protein JCM19039_4326 [Geomicrobium sp. JCM 19039]